MTDSKREANWLYGAEYWVPENHMFKSGSDCLEAFPDAGPACGIVSTTSYDSLLKENQELRIQMMEAQGYIEGQDKEITRLREIERAAKAVRAQFGGFHGVSMDELIKALARADGNEGV